MSTDTKFVRKTKGITGSIGAVFNFIGSCAGALDNIAAGCEEATMHYPNSVTTQASY